MALRDKRVVRLTADQRHQLDRLVSSGRHPARVLTRARILLKADAGAAGPGWEDAAIADALECGARTVARVRRSSPRPGWTPPSTPRGRPAGSTAS